VWQLGLSWEEGGQLSAAELVPTVGGRDSRVAGSAVTCRSPNSDSSREPTKLGLLSPLDPTGGVWTPTWLEMHEREPEASDSSHLPRPRTLPLSDHRRRTGPRPARAACKQPMYDWRAKWAVPQLDKARLEVCRGEVQADVRDRHG
jgi:hypothetical protein